MGVVFADGDAALAGCCVDAAVSLPPGAFGVAPEDGIGGDVGFGACFPRDEGVLLHTCCDDAGVGGGRWCVGEGEQCGAIEAGDGGEVVAIDEAREIAVGGAVARAGVDVLARVFLGETGEADGGEAVFVEWCVIATAEKAVGAMDAPGAGCGCFGVGDLGDGAGELAAGGIVFAAEGAERHGGFKRCGFGKAFGEHADARARGVERGEAFAKEGGSWIAHGVVVQNEDAGDVRLLGEPLCVSAGAEQSLFFTCCEHEDDGGIAGSGSEGFGTGEDDGAAAGVVVGAGCVVGRVHDIGIEAVVVGDAVDATVGCTGQRAGKRGDDVHELGTLGRARGDGSGVRFEVDAE